MIEGVGIPWCFRDKCREMAKQGNAFIINLDDSTGPGTHWTAARLVDNILYYADPFGTMLNGWPPEELNDIGDKKIINRISFQRPSTKLCGYYAMAFAAALDYIGSPMDSDQFERLLYQSII